MPKFDDLSDRMKFYEKEFGANLTYLMPLVPSVIRLDGKAFHSFTRGLNKPYDIDFNNILDEITETLVQETNAVIGYRQSDEISLILYEEDFSSQMYFDGKIDKINSTLAGLTSSRFNELIKLRGLYDKVGRQLGIFDCRCFSVPNKTEACNYLVWREQDAVRNSIQSLGHSKFSESKMHGIGTGKLQEMLWAECGINWNSLSVRQRRGSYFRRVEVTGKIGPDELESLPEKHQARKNPDMEFTRHVISRLDMARITQVDNIEDVVFKGAEPL